MTKLTLTALVAAVLGGCAAAPWTQGEKVGEGAYLTLHTVDWAQTRWIATHGPAYYESFNSVLGRRPSTKAVDAWFATTTVLQPLIANGLPRDWRRVWIGSGVGLEFGLTTHNASLGVKLAW